MESTNWLTQTDQPLYPDLLWAKPENKRQSGKLLIIGGHKQSFSAVSKAYAAASKAGAGTIRVLLPMPLQKMLAKTFPEAEFADSTTIGSFSRQALGLFLELSDWADGVLLAGEFGRNSETAILLENYVAKSAGQLTLAGDSLDYFYKNADAVMKRPQTTLVGSLAQIQRLAPSAIRQQDQLAQLVNKLSIFTDKTYSFFITLQNGQIIVAGQGKVSTTSANKEGQVGEELAAYASVWRLQQPAKPFEASTTAAYCFSENQ